MHSLKVLSMLWIYDVIYTFYKFINSRNRCCFVWYFISISAAFGFAIHTDWKCMLVGAPVILEIIKHREAFRYSVLDRGNSYIEDTTGDDWSGCKYVPVLNIV